MWIAVPLILLAGAAIGCGKSEDKEDKKEKIGPDPKAQPLSPPPPSTPLPSSPKDLFARCFGPVGRYMTLVVEHPGRGLCGRFEVPRPMDPLVACFSGADPACDLGPMARLGRPFHLFGGTRFDSKPPEALSAGAGSAVWPDTVKRIADFWYVTDGGLYDDCRFLLQWWQGVSTTAGISRNLGGLQLPLYAPRKDGRTCEAEPDFSNEKVLHLAAPLCASFPAPGAAPSSVTATEVKSGAECDNRLGKTLPLKMMLQLK